jgi:hypothetical protein
MADRQINVGDFIIATSRFTIDYGRVTRVTKSFVYRVEEGWDREWRCDKSQVLFAGPEAIAKRVKEQLVSSDAQCTHEKQTAYARQKVRDKKIIENGFAEVDALTGGDRGKI